MLAKRHSVLPLLLPHSPTSLSLSLRLRVLAEVGIAFILREVFIGLYDHSMDWTVILALAVLLAVLASAWATHAVGLSLALGAFLALEQARANFMYLEQEQKHGTETRNHPPTHQQANTEAANTMAKQDSKTMGSLPFALK